MKRVLLFLLSFMVFSNSCLAYTQQESADILVKMNVISGYPDGTLGLERTITRAEFATLAVKLLGYDITSSDVEISKDFNDLKSTHWAYNSVMLATSLGLFTGYEDDTFRPSNTLTYAECCSIIIGMLGHKEELVGKWPLNVINLSTTLGINKGIIAEASTKITRGDVCKMLINSMDVIAK